MSALGHCAQDMATFSVTLRMSRHPISGILLSGLIGIGTQWRSTKKARCENGARSVGDPNAAFLILSFSDITCYCSLYLMMVGDRLCAVPSHSRRLQPACARVLPQRTSRQAG